MAVSESQVALFLHQVDTPPAGPLTPEALRDRLKGLQRATLEQMLDCGPDPARLALMAGIRAALEAIEMQQPEPDPFPTTLVIREYPRD